jgi:hypothetical protein
MQPESDPGVAMTHLLRLEIDRQGNVSGYRGASGNSYTGWRIPKVSQESMKPLGHIRYVAGTSYAFDGTMTGSFQCESGCLPEPPGKRKGKASTNLLRKMANGLRGESRSQPSGIQVQVVKIDVPSSGIQGLLIVTFKVRIRE